jgi:hypothetical protein
MVLPSAYTFYNAYGHNEEDQTLMRLGQVVKRGLRQTGSAPPIVTAAKNLPSSCLKPQTRGCVMTGERIQTEFK